MTIGTDIVPIAGDAAPEGGSLLLDLYSFCQTSASQFTQTKSLSRGDQRAPFWRAGDTQQDTINTSSSEPSSPKAHSGWEALTIYFRFNIDIIFHRLSRQAWGSGIWRVRKLCQTTKKKRKNGWECFALGKHLLKDGRKFCQKLWYNPPYNYLL